MCARVVGVERGPRHEPARPGDARRSVLDPERARRELGFSAEISLADGLAATLASVREE
jgi:UDP-glucose 4-epimerase